MLIIRLIQKFCPKMAQILKFCPFFKFRGTFFRRHVVITERRIVDAEKSVDTHV